MEKAIENYFIANLPKKPYSTNDYSIGLKIRKLEEAIKRTHLQHNPPAQIVWMVFDCDRANSFELASQDSFVPAPNFEVFNINNGHSHLFYGLESPVTVSDAGKSKPIKYLSAIEYSLGKLLDADQNYGGLISKNPLHPKWETVQRRTELWTLNELADWLELPSKLPAKAMGYGLGRNCSIFDTVRKWAYKEVLKYRLVSNSKNFHKAVLDACIKVNNTFQTPLVDAEISAIAKSIANWVWKKYTAKLSEQDWKQYVQDTHTPEIQSVRGKRSGVVRNSKILLLRNEARVLYQEGAFTQEELAEIFDVNQATISRWIK